MVRLHKKGLIGLNHSISKSILSMSRRNEAMVNITEGTMKHLHDTLLLFPMAFDTVMHKTLLDPQFRPLRNASHLSVMHFLTSDDDELSNKDKRVAQIRND